MRYPDCCITTVRMCCEKDGSWKYVDLWNNLGFSLYAMPFVCHMIITSDRRMKSKMGVSADWCVAVEYWRLSSIRIIFVNYQTSKL